MLYDVVRYCMMLYDVVWLDNISIDICTFIFIYQIKPHKLMRSCLLLGLNQFYHHHHLFWKCSSLPCKAGVRFLPYIKSLHISLNTIAQPGCNSDSLMSWILHTLSPSLSAPARCTRTFHPRHHHISVRQHPIIPTLTLKTIIPSYHTKNLPCLTTSATHWIPRRLHKSSQCFLSFKDTPHIHLTIIRSALFRLFRFSAFIAQASVSYVKTLWTHAL